jgi:hypothetical protein
MTPTRNFVVAALCGIALATLPLGGGLVGVDQAQAKSGGNGGGNGGGGGNGNGNGGGNAGGKGASGGKSAGNSAQGSQSKSASAASSVKTNNGATKQEAKQQVAAVAKEKNLNAQLGSLNSLKRNINAYINSKSPKFALVQEFVKASAQFDLAQQKLADANATVEAEQGVLDKYTAELETLNAMDVDALTPEQQARLEALPGLIAEQEGVVEEAKKAAIDAEAAATAAAVGTDDASLEAALEAMSNKTVNAEVMTWAKEVLGVGEEIGKIDEMSAALKAEAEAEVVPDPVP